MPDRQRYPTDLTDKQWALVEPFVRASHCGPQEVLHPRREVVNAILYIKRTGAQWRYMPHDLPDWRIVYHYFARWKKDGTWKNLNDELRREVRTKEGHEEEPTAGVLDSQSVKTVQEAETKGYDAGKKIKGRKRHLLVDALGLLLVSWISTADVQDRDGARKVLPVAAQQYPTLKKTWVDGGYSGERVQAVATKTGINVEVVKRSDQAKGFVLLPKRWIVERTFGWLNRQRRLSKDYERKESSSEAFIHISMIDLMLRRLA
ncbi:transposase [Melittangium boletus DSM 14713]|uniref:Transposase n=2 Tax=Melittangium boletus TaxID=83453 RepID=A0A250IM96_9BACT|nr:transposase [Melittangium boletus DSM 14713]